MAAVLLSAGDGDAMRMEFPAWRPQNLYAVDGSAGIQNMLGRIGALGGAQLGSQRGHDDRGKHSGPRLSGRCAV